MCIARNSEPWEKQHVGVTGNAQASGDQSIAYATRRRQQPCSGTDALHWVCSLEELYQIDFSRDPSPPLELQEADSERTARLVHHANLMPLHGAAFLHCVEPDGPIERPRRLQPRAC